MTTRALSKKIFIIAIPASVQFIVNQIQVSTDMAFIGHYSTAGLSAIHNARVAFFLFLSFFLSFANGTNILVAQSLGAKDLDRARGIAGSSLFYNQLLSFGYLFGWLFFGERLLSLLGVSGEILPLSAVYVRIVASMYLAEGLILTSSAIFQGRGHTLPITLSALIRASLNIPLDWCLIYGKWIFPEMGVAGAAIATAVSELIGGAFLIFLLFRDRNFPISLRDVLRPVRRLYGKVVRLGLPNGLEFMVWAAGSAALLALLNALDPKAAGYYGITEVIKVFNLSMYHGLGVATITLVGMAVGAKDPRMAKRAGTLTVSYSMLICVAMGAIYALFPAQILGIFLEDERLIRQLQPLLYLVALTLLPMSYNVVGANGIRARGDVQWLLKVQIVGICLLIPLAYLAMFRFGLGVIGLLGVILFDEFWRALANYARTRYWYRRG